MKPIVIKGIAGTLGASGLVVGGYYGVESLLNEQMPTIARDTAITENQNHNKKKKIREILSEDKYELLNSQPSNDQHWQDILSSYQTVTSKQKALKFDGFAGNELDAKEKLQKICDDAFDSENDDNYAKIKKWCVVPIDIVALLTKRNVTILDTNRDDSAIKKVWEEKIKSYKNLSTDELKITDLNLTDKKDQAEELDYTNIKNKCNEIKTKKSHEEGFENLLKKFETWCANKTS